MKSSFFNRLRQSPKTLYISTSLRRLQVFLLICVLTCLLGPVKGTELTTQTSDIHQILQGVTNTPPGLEDASESSFSRKGEFYLGGLFDIHLEQDGVCKAINPRGLQWMYAMVYAIELINARQDLLPNITLGKYTNSKNYFCIIVDFLCVISGLCMLRFLKGQGHQGNLSLVK